MRENDFRTECFDILDPFYPDASLWLDKNWPQIVDAVKKHGGRKILKALINCVNRKPVRGKLEFFFKDLAIYLPENDHTYFSRQGNAGSMITPAKLAEEKRPLTAAEQAEADRLMTELKNKFPTRYGG